MLGDEKTSFFYKWVGGGKKTCGICKLRLIGAQLLIVKSKVGIVFQEEF